MVSKQLLVEYRGDFNSISSGLLDLHWHAFPKAKEHIPTKLQLLMVIKPKLPLSYKAISTNYAPTRELPCTVIFGLNPKLLTFNLHGIHIYLWILLFTTMSGTPCSLLHSISFTASFASFVTYDAARAVANNPSPNVSSSPFPPARPTLDSS